MPAPHVKWFLDLLAALAVSFGCSSICQVPSCRTISRAAFTCAWHQPERLSFYRPSQGDWGPLLESCGVMSKWVSPVSFQILILSLGSVHTEPVLLKLRTSQDSSWSWQAYWRHKVPWWCFDLQLPTFPGLYFSLPLSKKKKKFPMKPAKRLGILQDYLETPVVQKCEWKWVRGRQVLS